MTCILANNPEQLHDHLRSNGHCTNGKRSSVRIKFISASHVEIPLSERTLRDIATVAELESCGPDFRDLMLLSGLPPGSRLLVNQKIVERKLVFLGLIEVTETGDNVSVCALSELARRGVYVAEV